MTDYTQPPYINPSYYDYASERAAGWVAEYTDRDGHPEYGVFAAGTAECVGGIWE